jgi:hypothetical protein
MAMPTTPKALYPSVPNAPGVPPLLRNAARIADTATSGLLGISDELDLLIGAEPVKWGVFDAAHQPVAVADSVISFEYRNGSRISDYPLEQGAFASYNKVANPYDAKVRMVCSGSEAKRTVFINALEAASKSIALYTVVTPEVTYLNANIESWDYRRESSNGAHVIIADLHIREIRETATAAFSAPKSPSAADTQSQGQVQTFSVPNPSVSVRVLR